MAERRPAGAPEEEPRPAGAPGPEEPAAAEEAAVDQDLDALEDTKRERDEYLDLAQRTRADFENYRKRVASEVAEASQKGKAELARGLVGVLDNLERALQVAGIDESSEGPLEEGILLTYRDLRSTLERAGVEPIDPAGERFDPQWHEAVSTSPDGEGDSGAVAEVLQKGYRIGEQLIRPARVVVRE